MDVIVKDEFESKEELQKYLLDNMFIENNRILGWCLDFSKFLREDKTYNLELLEIAVEYMIELGAKEYQLLGQGMAWEKRDIKTAEQWEEEYTFIKGFISSVWEEFYHDKQDG